MKNIFITGASKGIGKAAAIHFANQGWRVGCTDIDEPALKQLEEELTGQEIWISLMDVTKIEQIDAALKSFTQQSGGKLDVLFNNAGIAWIDRFDKMTIEQHHATINVNCTGVLNCTYGAYPYLKGTDGARVISMCSASAHYGIPIEATYSATKFFVRGLTEALNLEWEADDIHVCDIMPNFVDTPMMEGLTSELVDNIGISLTVQDVVSKIWKASQKKKVHWIVEVFPYNIVQPLSGFFPRSFTRSTIKKLSGL